MKGGFGNQLFQYAFGLSFKNTISEDVYFDISYFEKAPQYLVSFNKLNVRYNVASKQQLKQICIFKHNQAPHSFSHRVFVAAETLLNRKYFFTRQCGHINLDSLRKYNYLDGYWQSYKFFDNLKSQLRQEFLPKEGLSENAILDIESVKNKNSVCVGLRLGDYSKESKYYIPTKSYYKKAIEYLLEKVDNPVFIVFSDEIEKAKVFFDFLGDFPNCQFIFRTSSLHNYEELWVMTACKHAIIPNSTFHWWAAWLKDDPNSIIVAPPRWFNKDDNIDLIPQSWIRIEIGD